MSEDKVYLWQLPHLQMLRNQLLTGYKTIIEGAQVSFVPLTNEEKQNIELEIKSLTIQNDSP